MTRLTPTDLQRHTLRLYGELVSRRPNYGGQLVLTAGARSSATGLPTAVSIAGGTTLAIDPDAAAVKSTFRQGGLDFVVNSLDEALRVLKNEIRQHRPLAVALIAPVAPALTEMLDRGVLPDLHIVLYPGPDLDPTTLYFPRSQRLSLHLTDGLVAPSAHLADWLTGGNLTETILTSATNLRTLDARLLTVLPPHDTLRRTWLERISHYQRPTPDGSRVLWLTHEEQASERLQGA